jgi:pimeloyl-ACP methyl ester carboxylesterase
VTELKTEPLLLVPGLLCTPDLFTDQMADFGRDRTITTVDHTCFDRLETIVRATLAAAPKRFALAGLSMGGYIAMEIMRQAPERVTRLALLDTSARPDTPDRTADRRRLIEIARSEGVGRVQRLLMPRLIHPDRLAEPDFVARVVRMAGDTGLDAFIRQQEAIIARPDSRPLLPTIVCPTLVLVGAEDLQTPVEVAREIADAIPGSRLEVVPNCGHLSTMERPEAVNAALRDWLA